MNPLNLSGPVFLLLWVVGWGAAIGIAYLMRRLHQRTGLAHDPEAIAATLHPTEVAFLAGGVQRAVEAAVVGLEHRGITKLDVRDRVQIVGPRPKRLEGDGVYRGVVGDEPLSAAELHVLARAPATLPQLVRAPVLEYQLEERLGQLVVARRLHTWLAIWALPIAWWGLGAAKVATGLQRDRPVLLLCVLLGLALTFAPLMLRVPRLTRLGESVLAKLVARNHGLATTAKISPNLVDATDMTLAYALFGPAVLAPSFAALVPSSTERTSWWSSGGGGCGASCGGGGGGCGGGCGGCS